MRNISVGDCSLIVSKKIKYMQENFQNIVFMCVKITDHPV